MFRNQILVVLGLLTSMSSLHAAPSSRPVQKVSSQPISSTQSLRVSRIGHGKINCFPRATMRTKSKKSATCEISAAIATRYTIWVANDKATPGTRRSSMMQVRYDAKRRTLVPQSPFYWPHPLFKSSKKIEDLTLTPDGRYVFASSAFDRIHASTRWDGYNRLLYWHAGTQQVGVFSSSKRSQKTNTIPLRRCIQKALQTQAEPQGAPYFKIEGLVALPGNRLLLGVRERGKRYTQAKSVVQLISVPYHIKRGIPSLQMKCTLVYDATQYTHRKIGRSVALSGLTYDAKRKRLYMLTSYEEGKNIQNMGGYLWTLSLDDLRHKRMPQLATTKQGKALHFAHKAEAVTLLNANTLLVVHDDDRATSDTIQEELEATDRRFRELHQSPYTILRIHEKTQKKSH